MGSNKKQFIPAFRFKWLSPVFDTFLRLTMHDLTFKQDLVKIAQIRKTERVLDLGCGTGTLTILLKEMYPESNVIGIDADNKILEIARAKVDTSHLDIVLDRGMAFDLPYPDNFFDVVISSLVFHHLTFADKEKTLKEVYRVLSPGGRLYILDFGKPSNSIMYLISLVMRHLEETADNFKGLIPPMIKEVGFVQFEIVSQYSTVFGTLCLYKGIKPGLSRGEVN